MKVGRKLTGNRIRVSKKQMNKAIESLCSSFEKMNEKQLLAFIEMYFSRYGMEDMIRCFILDSIENDKTSNKEELKKIKHIISRVKKLT